MRVALGLTAMNDGPAATQRCAAGLPSCGDRSVARLPPSTSADVLFATLLVSARPQRPLRPGPVFWVPAHVAVAAALVAVREWVFTPAFRHGIPVGCAARASIVFHLC